jgi:farnesyl-diphosphate farnesyltransferase
VTIVAAPAADARASDAADRAYVRAVLPRVSRTFAINIRLLRGSLGESVRVAYLLCRIADTLEDVWVGDAPALARRFDLFLAALAGDGEAAEALAREASGHAAASAAAHEGLTLVANTPRVWRRLQSLAPGDRLALEDGVRVLASGMRRYTLRAAGRPAAAPYLDTEAELHDYCWVVAGCVGVMLTRVFDQRARDGTAAEARRLALAPLVGEGLQLTNILLDWPADVRQGRCYVPAEWLAPLGLEPRDLVDRERGEVAALSRRLEVLARAALDQVPDYLDTIPARHVRYRLFCLWPALWARASLRCAQRDPTFPWGPRRPRLPRSELWRTALASLVLAHDRGSLRRLYAAAG